MQNTTKIDRAKGCMMGLFVGDALGAQYEFSSAVYISRVQNVGLMTGGGPFNLEKGQITDDSEMAISLLRSIVNNKGYSKEEAFKAYKAWANSNPFDMGITTGNALFHGTINPNSQSNGALMRLAPLPILLQNEKEETVINCAMQDASITHSSKAVLAVNAIMAAAMHYAINTGESRTNIYSHMLNISEKINAPEKVKQILIDAADSEPLDCETNMGWILIAFQLAVYHLLHAETFEEAIINTVKRGGDTDTNAAIVGSFLGSVFGINNIPNDWKTAVMNCTPDEASKEPRPREYWASKAFKIIEELQSSFI